MGKTTPTLRNNGYVRGTEHFYFRAHDDCQEQIVAFGDNEYYTISFGTFTNLLDTLHEIDEELHSVTITQAEYNDIRVRVGSETRIAMFVAICGMC